MKFEVESFGGITSVWKLGTVVGPTSFYLPCVLTINCDFAIYTILFSLVKNKNKIFPLSIAAVLNVSVNQERAFQSGSENACCKIPSDPFPA